MAYKNLASAATAWKKNHGCTVPMLTVMANNIGKEKNVKFCEQTISDYLSGNSMPRGDRADVFCQLVGVSDAAFRRYKSAYKKMQKTSKPRTMRFKSGSGNIYININ